MRQKTSAFGLDVWKICLKFCVLVCTAEIWKNRFPIFIVWKLITKNFNIELSSSFDFNIHFQILLFYNTSIRNYILPRALKRTWRGRRSSSCLSFLSLPSSLPPTEICGFISCWQKSHQPKKVNLLTVWVRRVRNVYKIYAIKWSAPFLELEGPILASFLFCSNSDLFLLTVRYSVRSDQTYHSYLIYSSLFISQKSVHGDRPLLGTFHYYSFLTGLKFCFRGNSHILTVSGVICNDSSDFSNVF